MATVIFRGDAQDQAQINTITVGGTAANGQVYTVTCNLKEVSYTATGVDTNTTISAALYALLLDAQYAEFQEVDYENSGLVTTVTGEAGHPFTMTSGATGTGTLVTATTQAAKGKHFWDDPDNWSGGAVPVTGDDVFIRNNTTDILYGFAQSAVTLASLTVEASNSGKIGLPNVNESGYYEYRDKYLAISATILSIGYGAGSGTGRFKINTGSNATTINVFSTGSPAEDGLPAVMWYGAHASNVLNIQKGSFGAGTEPSQAFTLATIRIGSKESVASDVQLWLGTAGTLTTINQSGGDVVSRSSVTTHTIFDGTFTLLDAATLGTLNGEGGIVYYESSGAMTAGVLRNNCRLECHRRIVPRTFTNLTLNKGTAFIDTFETVTFTNPFVVNCKLSELEIDLGSLFSLQRS